LCTLYDVLGSLLLQPVPSISSTTQPLVHLSSTVSVTSENNVPNVSDFSEFNTVCEKSEVSTHTVGDVTRMIKELNDRTRENSTEAKKKEKDDIFTTVESALSPSVDDSAVISKCAEEGEKSNETHLLAQIQTNDTSQKSDRFNDEKPEHPVLNKEIGLTNTEPAAQPDNIQPNNSSHGNSMEMLSEVPKKDAVSQIEKKKGKIEFSSISHFLTLLREQPKNTIVDDNVSASMNTESKDCSQQSRDGSQPESFVQSDTRNENKSHSRSRECSNQKVQKRSRSRSRGRAARGKRSRSRSFDRNRRESRRSRSRQRDRSQRETRKSRSRDRSRRNLKRSRSRSRDRRERRSRSRDQNKVYDKQRTGSPNRGRYYRDHRRSSSRSKEQTDQHSGMSVKDTGRPRDRKRSRSRSREQNRQHARRRSGSPMSRNQQFRQKEWDSLVADHEEQGLQVQNSGTSGSKLRLPINAEQSSPTHLEENTIADKSSSGRDFESTVVRGEQSAKNRDDNWRHELDDCNSRISVIASGSQVDNGRRDNWNPRQRHSSGGAEEHHDVPLSYDPALPTEDAVQTSRSSLHPSMPPRGPPAFAWQPHDRMPRFDNRLPPPPILNMQLPNNPHPPHPFFNRPPPGSLHNTTSQSGSMPAAFGFVPAGGVRQPFMVDSFPSRLPPPPPPSFQNTGRMPSAGVDSSGRPPFSLVPPPPQHSQPPQPPHVVRLPQTMERHDSVPLLLHGPVEFQQLHRFVIMPPPSVGQPVHLADQPRFAMCQVQQMPQNVLRLPMGQPPMSHQSLVLGQQLLMPPPGATLQLRPEAGHARPLGQVQLGIGCIDQNSVPSLPPMMNQSMFDTRFIRPPSSVAENVIEGNVGPVQVPLTMTSTQQILHGVSTQHHILNISEQQTLPISNNMYVSERSRSPSLSPTESEEMMAGEIFSQRSTNDRESFENTGHTDSVIMNSGRQSFLQDVPSCPDDQFFRSVSESAMSNGSSMEKLEPEVVMPIHDDSERKPAPNCTGLQSAAAYDVNRISVDSTLPPGVVKSAGPLDPRALLQYLLHQTRQTTTAAVVEHQIPNAGPQLSVRNNNDSGRGCLFGSPQNFKETRQATHSTSWGDSLNHSDEAPCEDPVDMNLDSPDSTQETLGAGDGNDVYSPSQADYAASPVDNIQTSKDSSGKKHSKVS